MKTFIVYNLDTGSPIAVGEAIKAEWARVETAEETKIRAENRPEAEMEALFRENREWEIKFFAAEKYAGKVGAFEGAMTPHTRIPLNQGICGAAASSGRTVVVDDVAKDPRYLACSLETKSEIVVPVFAHGKVVGELDIDSHFPAAFTAEHQEFVQHCAILVGKKLEAATA